jgi:hypothetical protein
MTKKIVKIGLKSRILIVSLRYAKFPFLGKKSREKRRKVRDTPKKTREPLKTGCGAVWKSYLFLFFVLYLSVLYVYVLTVHTTSGTQLFTL